MDNLNQFIEDAQIQIDDNLDMILKKYDELSEKIEKRLNEIKSKKTKK